MQTVKLRSLRPRFLSIKLIGHTVCNEKPKVNKSGNDSKKHLHTMYSNTDSRVISEFLHPLLDVSAWSKWWLFSALKVNLPAMHPKESHNNHLHVPK